MKKKLQAKYRQSLKLFLSIYSVMVTGLYSYAQDGSNKTQNVTYLVPKVALVDIEGGSTITLNINAPTEAGAPMTASASNNTLWLNYSSTTAPSRTNSISVRMNTSLNNIDFKVLASSAASFGAGQKGTPSSIVTLSTSNRVLVNNIGTCYTGNGVNRGHNLTYSIVIKNYTLLKYKAPTNVIITYTITNN